MTNALLGFRTITKAFIHRYVYEGAPAVLTPKPISIIIPPSTAEIDPGVKLGEIKSRTCKGPMQTTLTFKDETDPMLKLAFDLGGPEIEQMIHGQVVKRFTDIVTSVLFEFEATQAEIPGRTEGEHGFQVAAQDPETSDAMAYYIDPATKLAVPLTLVEAGQTDLTLNQYRIGAHLAIEISDSLAATGHLVQGRVLAVTPAATAMSNQQMGLVGVFLSGVYHDGTVKEFSARYCSLQYGSQLSADGKRMVNLRILPDANSRSGLGWDLEDIPLQMAC